MVGIFPHLSTIPLYQVRLYEIVSIIEVINTNLSNENHTISIRNVKITKLKQSHRGLPKCWEYYLIKFNCINFSRLFKINLNKKEQSKLLENPFKKFITKIFPIVQVSSLSHLSRFDCIVPRLFKINSNKN